MTGGMFFVLMIIPASLSWLLTVGYINWCREGVMFNFFTVSLNHTLLDVTLYNLCLSFIALSQFLSVFSLYFRFLQIRP